ncbi:MAG: XdhC family protein [Clostridiales Family XIII bacterium]|jgi:xanthine dehydrogenase accessory factor|nr:XdhC family protein [Clostridiales Family XIII bacterium]
MNIFYKVKKEIEDKNFVLLESLYKDGMVSRKISIPSNDQKDFSFEKFSKDNFRLVERVEKKGRMIVLGGGHIALSLIKIAKILGFSIIVFDDRPKFANNARFPEADEIIVDEFSNLYKRIKIHLNDTVVIITRGHKHDTTCLRWVLSSKSPKYTGMIGSRRRVAIVKDMLINEGFKKERLEAIYSPIGLNINALTPAEISIAILSEIIKNKRKGKDHRLLSENFDLSVLSELSKDNSDYNAMITIVKQEGSTPRTVGAKMLLSYDGRLMGSIGGGCAEGEVISIARNLIRKNGYALKTVDMSENAEDDGMVCGGNMEVIVESLRPDL